MQSGSDRIWHLLSRHLTNEITLDEQREVEVFLRDRPDVASQFEIHATYFSSAQNKKQVTDEEKDAWICLLQKLKETYPKDFTETNAIQEQNIVSIIKKNRIKFIAAASLLFAIVLSLFYVQNMNKETSLYSSEKRLIEFTTSPTEKTRITLPDGSIVWLNTNSHISYNSDFGKHNRNIALEGEAFFDVVHKAELPMVVHAGLIDVRVKGTAFNVNSYPNKSKIEASLIRGSIELAVAGQEGENKKIIMKPDEKVTIDMDNSITTTRDKKQRKIIAFTIDTLAVEAHSGLIPEVAWIENKLVFNSESFVEVAKKMEQWYNVEITIKNPVLMYEKFTGMLHNETLREALEALKMTYNFNYTINKNQVTIK